MDDSGVPDIVVGIRRKSSRPKKSVSFAVDTPQLYDGGNSTKENMQGSLMTRYGMYLHSYRVFKKCMPMKYITKRWTGFFEQ